MKSKSFLPIMMLMLVFVLSSAVLAQLPHYEITSAETWPVDQEWSTSVIVKSGGTLTIEAGVRVGIHYVDVNGDAIGDVKLEVESGGTLIIEGTPGNPVVFEPVGTAAPEGSENRHWQGIVMAASATDNSQLTFFEVHNANIGLTVARTVDVTGGTFVENQEAGVVVEAAAGAVKLIGCEVRDSDGVGIRVEGAGTLVRSATISGAAGNGIEVNAADVTIDWAVVSGAGTGLYNSPEALNTVITNGDFSTNDQSGLFNLDGSVTISNSRFSGNTFHGIVNSSGTLTLTESLVSANTATGIVAGGSSTNSITSVTVIDNAGFGVDITPIKMAADALAIDGEVEDPTPTVSFKFSNIYGNNGTDPDVNSSAGATPQADFTTNWWGQTSGIGALVSVDTPGSVDYINWKFLSYPEATAELSPTEAIAIGYPVDGQDILRDEKLTLTWTTVGNIPFVVVDIDVNPTRSDTVANSGSYTYTPNLAGAQVITVEKWDDDAVEDQSSVTVVAGPIALVYPAAGDTLYGRDAVSIRWVAAASIANVKLTYNDGSSAKTIVNSTPASAGSYTWTVPNISNATVEVTIENAANSTQNDNSGNFLIIPTPNYLAGGAWNYTKTNNNMTVYFGDPLNPTKNATGLVLTNSTSLNIIGNEKVYVGAFYLSGTEYKCAGYTLVDYTATQGNAVNATAANPVTLTIWGDDPNTAAVDGAPVGATLRFKIWRMEWSDDDPENEIPVGDPRDRRAFAYDSFGGALTPTTYQINDTQTREVLLYDRDAMGDDVHTIEFATAGWYIISSYVKPSTTAIDHTAGEDTGNIFTNSTNSTTTQGVKSFDEVTILKNDVGEVYWLFNATEKAGTLENWNYLDAYYVKIDASNQWLTIVGNQIIPEEEPLSLAAGWSMVPYFRDDEMSIATALTSIAPQVELVKNTEGKVYWPTYGINTIGDMVPGEGYLMKMSTSGLLRYPANTSIFAARFASVVQPQEPAFYEVGYNSYASSAIAILAESLQGVAQVNDEVGVFNSQEVLVGSAVFNGGNLGIVVWGAEEDSRTAHGMLPGEEYSFKIWHRETGVERELHDAHYQIGHGAFEINGVSVVDGFEGLSTAVNSLLPDRFELSHAYPNPFNPSTIIKFALPQDAKVQLTVYDVLGRTVRHLIKENMTAGYHAIEFDAGNLGSGVYFYKITAGSFSQTRKMSLLK